MEPTKNMNLAQLTVPSRCEHVAHFVFVSPHGDGQTLLFQKKSNQYCNSLGAYWGFYKVEGHQRMIIDSYEDIIRYHLLSDEDEEVDDNQDPIYSHGFPTFQESIIKTSKHKTGNEYICRIVVPAHIWDRNQFYVDEDILTEDDPQGTFGSRVIGCKQISFVERGTRLFTYPRLPKYMKRQRAVMNKRTMTMARSLGLINSSSSTSSDQW